MTLTFVQESLRLLLVTAVLSHFDPIEQNSEEPRVFNLISSGFKFIDIPVDPDKLALEKLGLRRRKPYRELTRKLSCDV